MGRFTEKQLTIMTIVVAVVIAGLFAYLIYEDLRKIEARLDNHLPGRGPNQRLTFKKYYEHFGLEEPFPLEGALDALGPDGARAVLWHQGETDNILNTSTADYRARLETIIARSRIDAARWINSRKDLRLRGICAVVVEPGAVRPGDSISPA